MEFEDKNLKTVVQKAAKAMKVPVESLKYEVLSYGSSGIFGLVGAKKAKIRVMAAKADVEIQKAADAPKKKAPKKDITETVKSDRVKNEIAATTDDDLEFDAINESVEFDLDAIELGRKATQRIVESITDGATVRVEEKQDQVVFHVEGGETAVLIGKRGQTLEAIQYVVDRIVNKKSENRTRIQIDVAGYLESKKTSLEQRALHLAGKVKTSGKPVTVGELNVYDRKIVHMSLKEDKDVRTQSMGSGFYRKLVIFPKRATATKQNKQ
jgi:spoIIIJ-associated protein